MNLMDVLTCKWDDRLLEASGGRELRSKLGPEPVPGGMMLGTISNWWVERWGFRPGMYIVSISPFYPVLTAFRLHCCTIYWR